MIDLNNKTAIITGAGSSIGTAVARLCVKLDANVILIAKSDKYIKRLQTLIKQNGINIFEQ